MLYRKISKEIEAHAGRLFANWGLACIYASTDNPELLEPKPFKESSGLGKALAIGIFVYVCTLMLSVILMLIGASGGLNSTPLQAQTRPLDPGPRHNENKLVPPDDGRPPAAFWTTPTSNSSATPTWICTSADSRQACCRSGYLQFVMHNHRPSLAFRRGMLCITKCKNRHPRLTLRRRVDEVCPIVTIWWQGR